VETRVVGCFEICPAPTGFPVLVLGVPLPAMAKGDRSESLRNEIQELEEEAAALTDRAKKTARQAEALSERIKHLQTQIAKKS
jgi:hypothetical protein